MTSVRNPDLKDLRKSAGSGSRDIKSLVAKAELQILQKEIEKSVISTVD